MASNPEQDRKWMSHAISLARRALGDTHPNPIVGAVIVRDGEMIAEGWHTRAGEAHAEIMALRHAGDRARGATLYVTLEPCSTHGRTPPCSSAIIEAGLGKVVIGATDPNPSHEGRAYELLKDAGIEVVQGVMEDECEDLNLVFKHWITDKQPFFAAKIATTIGGRIATRSGHSQWITGQQAREDVHRWRRYFPAIAVGRGTVLTDNPQLTARLPDQPEHCGLRLIFDRTLGSVVKPLPRVYSDAFREHTTVITSLQAPESAEGILREQGVEVVRLPSAVDAVFFQAFREYCVKQGITGVLFEGGGRLLSSMLCANQFDYLFAYRAPILLADEAALPAFFGAAPDLIGQGWRLADVRHDSFGADQLMRGRILKTE